jgi:hypothetical protein
MEDPIVEEIRTIRELAAEFGNDLRAIMEDVRRQEEASGRQYIQLPRRRTVEGEASSKLSDDTSARLSDADD